MFPDRVSEADRARFAALDRTDLRAATAMLHAAKGALAFLQGYDLDVPYEDLNWTDAGALKTWWQGHRRFLTARPTRSGSFDEAREQFRTALDDASTALAELTGGQTNGGWLERQGYSAPNVAEFSAAADDAAAALDGPHTVSASDFGDLHQDIVLDLSPLFATPLTRLDILPYDFEQSTVDWLGVDPTLKGIFPNETPASWYGRVAFIHNRDNETWEMDWPELADELDRETADACLDLAKGMIRFLGAYDLTADYDAACSDVDADVSLDKLWDDGGQFLNVRDTAALTESKTLLASGLDQAISAIDRYLAGPGENVPGYLFAEEGDQDRDRLANRRDCLEDVRQSLDGVHVWDAADYRALVEPLAVDLRPLFDTPLQRNDLLPYDFFGGDIDWLALDPTVRGILPNETRPSLYRRYVAWKDDPKLVPYMNAVDDEFADAVLDAADAAIQLLGEYDLRPTTGDVLFGTSALTKSTWESNAGLLTLRDATRATAEFAAARDTFAGALDKAQGAVDKMIAGEGAGGLADRKEWYKYGEGYDGTYKSSRSLFRADWLEVSRWVTAWRTAMGDAGAELPVSHDRPLLAHIRQLFDSPPTRASLPVQWKAVSEDSQFWRRFDWTSVPDPSFGGIFPGIASVADLAAEYTHYIQPPNLLLYRNGAATHLLWCFLHWEYGRWENSADAAAGQRVDDYTGPVYEQDQLYSFWPELREFEQLVTRYDIYRKTRTAAGTTEPVLVASVDPSGFGEWDVRSWEVPEPTANGEDLYRLDVVFTSSEPSEAATSTDWTYPYSVDATGGFGIPDWWEALYGISSSGYADGDGDGVNTISEYMHGTDPTKRDTDGDGVPDALELALLMDPVVPDASEDPDGDGYSSGSELAMGSDPQLYESNPADRPMPLSWVLNISADTVVSDAALPAGNESALQEYATGAVSSSGHRFFFTSSTFADPTRSALHIYARNMANGTVELVDAEDGTFSTPANGSLDPIFLTANADDGRYVLFLSDAANLNPNGIYDGWHFYLRDLSLGSTRQLPIPSPSGDTHGLRCAITPDGSHLVVETTVEAVRTALDDRGYTSSPARAVYWYDCAANTVVCCTDAAPGGAGISATVRLGMLGGSPDPVDFRCDTALSEDGRYVFLSTVAALVADDLNGIVDVYRYDAILDTVERVSIDPTDTEQVSGDMAFVAASADGRLVLLRAEGACFAAGEVPQDYLLLRDMERLRTVGIYSCSSFGPYASALLSRDGRYVAFGLEPPGDPLQSSQLWLFERTLRELRLLHTEAWSHTSFPTDPADELGVKPRVRIASMSEDGRYVFFRSRSVDLAVDGNPDYECNLYRYDTLHQRTEQVNLDSYGEAGKRSENALRYYAVDDQFLGATRDGRWVVLASAKNLANERQWGRDWRYPDMRLTYGRSLYLVDLTRREVTLFPGSGDTEAWSGSSWNDLRSPLLASHAPFAACPLALFAAGGTAVPFCNSVLARDDYYIEWDNYRQTGLGSVGWLDSDGDGLSDRFEKDFALSLVVRVGGDCDDGDGLDPTLEERLDLDPTNPDSDGDGTGDGDEFAGGTDPREDDADEDPDGDGWTNAEEFAAGLRPSLPDRSWSRHVPAGWSLACIPPGLAEEDRTIDILTNSRAGLVLYRYEPSKLRYAMANSEVLSEATGYWLVSNEAYDLDLTPPSGSRRTRVENSPQQVLLEAGWNLVSIPGYQDYPDVWTVFLRHPEVSSVCGWDAENACYYAVTDGDLDCLSAYWVYALEATVISFEGGE
jgi:hypothetical protein